MRIKRLWINPWLLLAFSACVLFYLGLWASGFQIGKIVGEKDSITVEHEIASPTLFPTVEPAFQTHPVVSRSFRLSLIPGGVSSLEELRFQIQADKVLGKIFIGFDWSKARIFAFDRDRRVWMTFRVGDSVYWSRRKVNVPAGTLAVTDGTRTLLMRCGNFISYVPQEPSQEIDPGVLEEPIEKPEFSTFVAFNDPSESLPLSPSTFTPPTDAPIFIQPGLCCFGAAPIPPPPVSTPEPPAIFLILCGVVGLYFVAMAAPRRNSR